MFPIPWNKEYRKKDGTLVNIADAMSGGGGGSDLPPHSSSDAGKVLTVGDDGTLEWDTSGSGGGDSFLSYDFTKWGNFTTHGVVMSESGAAFDSASDYFTLLTSDRKVADITLYIDTGDLVIPSGLSAHQRFVTSGSDANSGLIWRYSESVWSIYDGNGWTTSEITDPAFFDNCTFKIYIDANRYWHVYKDDTLVLESTNGIGLQNYAIYLGSSNGQSLTTGIIKGVRIYSGNYTE